MSTLRDDIKFWQWLICHAVMFVLMIGGFTVLAPVILFLGPVLAMIFGAPLLMWGMVIVARGVIKS